MKLFLLLLCLPALAAAASLRAQERPDLSSIDLDRIFSRHLGVSAARDPEPKASAASLDQIDWSSLGSNPRHLFDPSHRDLYLDGITCPDFIAVHMQIYQLPEGSCVCETVDGETIAICAEPLPSGKFVVLIVSFDSDGVTLASYCIVSDLTELYGDDGDICFQFSFVGDPACSIEISAGVACSSASCKVCSTEFVYGIASESCGLEDSTDAECLLSDIPVTQDPPEETPETPTLPEITVPGGSPDDPEPETPTGTDAPSPEDGTNAPDAVTAQKATLLDRLDAYKAFFYLGTCELVETATRQSISFEIHCEWTSPEGTPSSLIYRFTGDEVVAFYTLDNALTITVDSDLTLESECSLDVAGITTCLESQCEECSGTNPLAESVTFASCTALDLDDCLQTAVIKQEYLVAFATEPTDSCKAIIDATEEELERAFCLCGTAGVCLVDDDGTLYSVSYTFGDDGESILASIDLDDGSTMAVVNTGSGYNCGTTDIADPSNLICDPTQCNVVQDATTGLLSVDLSKCAASGVEIPAIIVAPSVFPSSRLLQEDATDFGIVGTALALKKKDSNSIERDLFAAAKHELM